MGGGMSKDRNKNWDLEAIADHEGGINAMAVSADKSVLVTGSEDFTARLWSTQEGNTECMGILRGHQNYITTVGIVGGYVITGSADTTIRKWDMNSCACLFVYEDTFEGHLAGVYPICFIPGLTDEEPARVDSGELRRRDDAQQAGEQDDLKLQEIIDPGDMLITGSADGTARSWCMASGKQLKLFKGHKGAVSCMAVDSGGETLYTAGTDSFIREWDIEKGVCTEVMKGHTDAVVCMQLVNKLLYTGSVDTTARCFITEFGDCTQTYKGHLDTVICLCFHNGILFTGCADMVVRAFDARSSNQKRTFTGHEAAVNCLVLVGDRLYTGSSDGVLRVWDARVQCDEISQIEAIKNKPDATGDETADRARE